MARFYIYIKKRPRNHCEVFPNLKPYEKNNFFVLRAKVLLFIELTKKLPKKVRFCKVEFTK